jgi:hypothetical protein
MTLVITRLTSTRLEDAAPNCSLRYGLARINETAANIGHLSDVANVTCSVPAATCARVSHEGRSSIFFYNFVCVRAIEVHVQVIDISVQESQDINTTCGSLIQPAKQVLDACATGYSYASGYVFRRMVDGSQSVPYLVVIGDDYVFAPNRGRSELDGEAYRDLEVLN